MKKAKIYYARMGEFWRKEKKLAELEKLGKISNVNWQEIQPNKNYVWLKNGLENEFEQFISIANKESRNQKGEVKDCIFKILSNGLHSSHDSWVYNFNKRELSVNIEKTIDAYNNQVNSTCK
jgi:predicted helicase